MKSKNLLYIILGMGIGFTICSIAFMIKPNIEVRDYTEQEIKQAAIELGFGDVKELIQVNTELKDDLEKSNKELQARKDELEIINEEFNELKSLLSLDNTKPSKSKESNNQEDSKDDENNKTEAVSADKEAAIDTDDYVILKIEIGDSSQNVTDKLYDLGVIDNKKAFNQLFYDMKAAKGIQLGIFKILKSDSAEDIIKVISNIN